METENKPENSFTQMLVKLIKTMPDEAIKGQIAILQRDLEIREEAKRKGVSQR